MKRWGGRAEREGYSLLYNDVQLQLANRLLGRTQGRGRPRESLKSVDVFRAGSEGALASGLLLSHGHPGLLWVHEDTPIRRREMWGPEHGGGVCAGEDFIG